ncbi:MAG: BatD family protein [Pseudomonadales bacterium]|nr:BatD family protein [Pseudomonadales bacterium]
MVTLVNSLMRQTRLSWLLLTLTVVLLSPTLVQAKVTASVDRNTISEQDIISLTLRSDSGSIPDNLDIKILERDFDILSRRQNSELSFINGQRSANYDLIFVIAPKRAGELTIPSFSVLGSNTNPIQIRVTPGPTDPRQAKSDVFLDSAVSKQEVYVQERLLYSLKVYHAVGLDNANITPVEIENAVIQQLGGQQKYETIIDGVRYSVIEIKYSVVPQRSGQLVIPEQVLTATALSLHGSIFRSDNRRVRTKSPTQIINVLPKPASYPSDQPWLPTEQLTLEDSWADRSIKLHLGESQTRTISIKAIGLDAAQLPNIKVPESDGLKFYPDQPVLNNQENSSNVIGERSLSVAIVPSREGPIELPPYSVTWWNTKLDRLETSLIPVSRMSVLPAKQQANNTLLPPVIINEPQTKVMAQQESLAPTGVWPALSAVFALLWIATLWLWWQAKHRLPKSILNNPDESYKQRIETRHQAHQLLQKAVKSHDPAAARPALIAWFNAVFPDEVINNLDDVRQLDCHPEINSLVLDMENRLYGLGCSASAWQGEPLLAVLEQIRRAQKKQTLTPNKSPLKPLYPM